MKTIYLSWDNLWPLVNVLNEVCHGIYVDIEKSTGYRYEKIYKLLEKLNSFEVDELTSCETSAIEFSNKEIAILIACLNVVAIEIEEWEFQTRIGVTLDEIRNNPIFTSKSA